MNMSEYLGTLPIFKIDSGVAVDLDEIRKMAYRIGSLRQISFQLTISYTTFVRNLNSFYAITHTDHQHTTEIHPLLLILSSTIYNINHLHTTIRTSALLLSSKIYNIDHQHTIIQTSSSFFFPSTTYNTNHQCTTDRLSPSLLFSSEICIINYQHTTIRTIHTITFRNNVLSLFSNHPHHQPFTNIHTIFIQYNF